MEEKLSERDVLSIDAEKYIENHNNAGYGRRVSSYTAPTVWNKLPYKIRNAPPSVTLFRKKLKTLNFKLLQDRPMGCTLSGPEVY